MKEIFQTDITDKEWWIYDICGNIGWILYGAGIGIGIAGGGFHQTGMGMSLFLLQIIAAVGILVGLVELISERVRGLDRILPKIRLYRGFGCIATASFIGGIVSLLHWLFVPSSVPQMLMAIGGLLCFWFCHLLFASYKKQ